MTPQEFLTWRKHHIALFPGLANYLRRTFGDNTEQVELFWKEWLVLLKNVPANDAITASRTLATIADEKTPYEQHPRLILELARKTRLERLEREWPPDNNKECDICYNSGVVTIASVTSNGRVYETATACTCRLGEHWKKSGLREFNPENDVTFWDYQHDQEAREIITRRIELARERQNWR